MGQASWAKKDVMIYKLIIGWVHQQERLQLIISVLPLQLHVGSDHKLHLGILDILGIEGLLMWPQTLPSELADLRAMI